jgi:hypothetical protein
VLADDLIHCTTLLAYAEGERLSGCLDLIHVPSQHLWVEWLEATRQAALRQIPEFDGNPYSRVRRRTGVFIDADIAGRAGTMRTFWSTENEQVYSAALVTDFDLDRVIRPALDIAAVFNGAGVGVKMPEEAALDDLLSHVCFRLDPAWADYYRSANLPESQQLVVLREVLGTTAFDMPMIFSLFLLFTAKDGVQRRVADLGRLNHARRRSGKRELLEHIEVAGPIAATYESTSSVADSGNRRGPRLHHVRGHIARRGDKVFWRSPHLRGNARMGVVRSRTVELSFR